MNMNRHECASRKKGHSYVAQRNYDKNKNLTMLS